MSEQFRWSVSGTWLLASFFFLILPVFLPSSANPWSFIADPIGVSTAAMYVLSFPSGLLSLPLSLVTDNIFGIDSNTMQGMYLNLNILFVLGLAQWFWIVPRLLHGESTIQPRAIDDVLLINTMPVRSVRDNSEFFDSNNRTPVERVIDQEFEQ